VAELPIPRHQPARDSARLLTPLGTALVVGLAALIRFWALGRPGLLVFDETYYVKDAFTLWQLGFEAQWPADINAAFEAGDVFSFLPDAAFVVHPPVGKWLIALGLMVGGAENAWAWRLSSAVVGVLAVWMMIRIARRLFGSDLIGLIAGLLLAVDGLAIVQSRIALLDQFLMFFVLAAFGALLQDRTQFFAHIENLASLSAGFRETPTLNRTELSRQHRKTLKPNFRWWRLLAGVLLGLACGVKWSGAYFLAGFGLLTVWWDLTGYRALAWHTGKPFRVFIGSWLRQTLAAFLSLVPVAALTYLATWFSWFRTPGSWGRNWAEHNPGAGITWLPPLLRSWVHYHSQVWTFHTGLDSPHPYESQAASWLLQIRPTAFFWGDDAYLANYPRCERLHHCSMAINSLGNPILWWLGFAAILATIWFGWVYRDWRGLASLSGIAFGWLPWLLYPDRTTFTFYSIAFLPWIIFTICYAFTMIRNWRWGRDLTLALVIVIVAVSIWFYPIWTALPIERSYWESLMWLRTWV